MASLPNKLGKYQILEKIGEGGFGTVYKAIDTTLDRVVALKVLKQVLLAHPVLIERFRREAKAAAALERLHIVSIYEVGEEQGCFYVAMTLVRGFDLRTRRRETGGLAVPVALRIAAQVASALDYAHAQCVILRDVKSANILLDEDGRALLGDFGLMRPVLSAS